VSNIKNLPKAGLKKQDTEKKISIKQGKFFQDKKQSLGNDKRSFNNFEESKTTISKNSTASAKKFSTGTGVKPLKSARNFTSNTQTFSSLSEYNKPFEPS
jgi:hypothetical protein